MKRTIQEIISFDYSKLSFIVDGEEETQERYDYDTTKEIIDHLSDVFILSDNARSQLELY